MHPIIARFSLFGVERPITSYGTLLVIAAAIGIALTVRRAPAAGIERFDALAAGLLGLGGGWCGAVALYVIAHARELLAEPHPPGLVFFGGLGGGALAAAIYARAYGVALPQLADAAAPGLALAHAVGRLGCFAAGCCYGRPAPFGVELWGARRHPVQLYEAAALIAIALGLLLVERRRARPPGTLFLLYLAAYAVVRLGTELLRGDDAERGFLVPGVLSISQAAAIATLVAVALTLRARPRSVQGAR